MFRQVWVAVLALRGVCLAVLALSPLWVGAQSLTLIPAGAFWKYLDDGSDQGTAWQALAFDDGEWESGRAELGYGDGGEATVVDFGPEAGNKYPTTYFRHAFTMEETNLTAVTNLILRVLRDDGVIVYLNGQEIFRNSMFPGVPNFRTYASATTEGTGFLVSNVPPASLQAGMNVIAAEIHQAAPDSSDISFNLELIAQLAQGPPAIRSQPRSLSLVTGQQGFLSVKAAGIGPLLYQWFREDSPLAGATNSSFTIANATANEAGDYYVEVSNHLGALVSATATVTVTAVADDTFQIAGLTADNAVAVPNTAIAFARGGIALSLSRLLVNGSEGAASLEIDTLAGRNIGRLYDALISNLRTEKIYTFANGTNPVLAGTVLADRLLEVDAVTGEPTTNGIALSEVVNLGFGGGFFSGVNRAVVLNGTRALNIALPSGQVTDLGAMEWPPHLQGQVGFWGVAEYFDGTVYVTYVRDFSTIVRTAVPSGLTENVATFANLGFMTSFTVSPSRGSWYFHTQGGSQFGNAVQVTGYADGQFSYTTVPRPPTITTEPQGGFVSISNAFSLTVTAVGTPPLRYQWFFNDEPIPHGTNATLTVDSATEDDSGIYFVLVENAAGSASSSPVTVSVGRLATELFDDFEPGIDASQWLLFSSVVAATNHGGSVSGNNALWFGGDGDRFAVTRPLDLSAGGLVTFQLRLSDGGGFPWEQVDVPGEGVVVEYSAGDASNWVEIARFDDTRFYSWSPQVLAVPQPAQTAPVFLRWRQLSNSGSPNDHWVIDDVRVRAPSGPPEIFVQPASANVIAGGTATFFVAAGGTPPLGYQWFFDKAALANETNAALVIANAGTNHAGAYYVVVSNTLGSVTSSNANLQVIDIGGDEFQILEILPTGARVVQHANVTGDDRGGIAASATRVFYSGDNSTARFNLSDLGGAASLNRIYDAMVSNLRTETVYTLAAGTTPLSNGGGTADTLIELDGNTGLLTSRTIKLSARITLNGGIGFFSGLDRVVIHTGSRVIHISLPSGTVVDLGPMSFLNAQGCENWAYWGVAEFFDGALHLAYANFGSISRARVPDGTIQVIGQFSSLSDMCSFTVSIPQERWYFHHEGTSQFGGGDESIGFADAAFRSPLPPTPVQITTQPQNASVLEGSIVTFDVSVRGTRPIFYQWRFNENEIPGATNASLVISNATAETAGRYSVQVSNVLATVLSSNATLSIEPVTADTFQVAGLFRTGARVINHSAITGDDRGGIAVSSNQVFYSGDEATGRFGIDDLSGGTRVGRIYDALVSNLRTEQVYTLANGGTPLGSGGGTANALIEINGNTGALTATRINFSSSIALPSSGVGIFSGWDRIVLHTGSRAYQITLPSGQVRDMGAMAGPLHVGCENWAYWGVAEFFANTLYLVYVRDFQVIARSRVPDGQTTELARFNGLGDMCSMSVSPYRKRWYFHYEGGGEFGGFDEVIGFADAHLVFAPIAPRITSQPRGRSTIEGAGASFSVGASGGAAPLFYQWLHNGVPLGGETNSALRLFGVQTNQAGEYRVVVSNFLGSATSQVASLVFRPLRGNSFRVASLTTNSLTFADVGQTTGSRRSSIALSSSRLFHTGFGGTGRAVADDLSNAGLPGTAEDGLVCDLHSERVYALADGTNHFTVGIPRINLLIELDRDTGLPAGPAIALSQDIPMGFDLGLYSGFERVVIHNGTNVFNIDLPSGQVTDLGPMAMPLRNTCAVPINWGIAEYFNGAVHLVYMRGNTTAARTRVPSGQTTTLATFQDLGDTCAITFSPSRSRWYFAFNFSQFNFNPSVASANAGWDQPNTLPIISLAQTSFQIIEDTVLGDVPVVLFDAETAPANLVLTIDSSNPALLPPSSVEITDTGTNRVLSAAPLVDANGEATITLVLTDAHGVSVTNHLEIVVLPANDPPAFAKGEDLSVLEDAGGVGRLGWATGILAGPANEASQQLTFITQTDNPTLFVAGPSVSVDGALIVELSPNANGMANVTVALRDNGGTENGGQDTSAPQSFRIVVVPVNDPPTFMAGPDITILEDAAPQVFTGWATGIAVGPPDEAGQLLTFLVSTDNPALFEGGLAFDAAGTLAFTPRANGNGSANVTVVLQDDGGALNGGINISAPRTFRITIQPVNDAPVANSQSVSVNEDGSVAITLGGSDVEGDTLSYSITQPSHGTLSGVAPSLTYTPNADYFGDDSFTFRVSDGEASSSAATVSITVLPVNDSPVAVIDVSSASIVETNGSNYVLIANSGGAPVALDGSRSSDVENEPLQYYWFEEGAPVPFAEGVRVTNLFAAGTHVIVLMAWDGEDSGHVSVVLEVLTPGQGLELLIALVENSNILRNTKRPFIATLKAASAAFEDGRMIPAVNQLHAFQNKVRAQIAPSDPALAEALIEEAQRILDVVGRH